MRNSLYILFLGAMLVLLNACSDNTSLPSSETPDAELATVHLRVSTRANDGADSNMDANEGIKALRVIVLNADWKILENWYQEGLGGTDGQTEEQTVTLKLPRTKVRFLAIANEKSMGRSFDTASLMADFSSEYAINGLKNIFNRAWDDATPAFPQTAAAFTTFSDAGHTNSIKTIAEYGLPMTGIKGGYDIFTGQGSGTGTGEHHDYNSELYMDTDAENDAPIDLSNVTSIDIEIPLVRCVSKIVVNVTNAMAQDLTIQSVNFGRFFANKVYYYAHNPLHLPGETDAQTHIFNFENEVVIEAGKEKQTVFVGYIFPVSLPKEETTNPPYRYSIALRSNVDATSTYTVFLKKDPNTATTDIGRNKMLVVNCAVNVHSLTVTNLKLEVEPWDETDTSHIVFD